MSLTRSLPVAAVLLIAGCGSGGSSSSATPATAVSPSTAVSSPSVSASASPSASAAAGAGALRSATFTASGPATWTAIAAPKPTVAAVRGEATIAAPARKNGFRDNVNVVSQAVPASLTVHAMAEQTVKAIKKQGFTVLSEPEKGTLDGEEAEAYAWSFPAKGTRITQVQVVAAHGGRAYFVTLSSASQKPDEVQPLLKTVISSWHWS